MLNINFLGTTYTVVAMSDYRSKITVTLSYSALSYFKERRYINIYYYYYYYVIFNGSTTL